MRRTTYPLAAILLALLTGLPGGCARLLGTPEGYLLRTFDRLTPPGQQVQLSIRVQHGDVLWDNKGCEARFYLDGQLYRSARTDDEGYAVVAFTPSREGNYKFRVTVRPQGLTLEPDGTADLLVCCRKADTPIAIVDLDHTLVAGGSWQVLTGKPQPMADSREVMNRLAGRYTIVYLTHRPSLLGPRSKAWLSANGYPPGPVMLAEMGQFLDGSEKFKYDTIAQMQQQFSRIELGIGDRRTDVRAYRQNSLTAIMIVPPPRNDELVNLPQHLGQLPGQTYVVSSWLDIEKVVFPATQPASRQAGDFPAQQAQTHAAD